MSRTFFFSPPVTMMMVDANKTNLLETTMAKATTGTEARVQVAVRARPLNQREVRS